MSKLHLPATAPNAGAVLLVRYLMSKRDMVARINAIERRIGAGMVQRIVTGEVVPASEMIEVIDMITLGAVPHRTWRHPTKAWWFERTLKQKLEAAGRAMGGSIKSVAAALENVRLSASNSRVRLIDHRGFSAAASLPPHLRAIAGRRGR